MMQLRLFIRNCCGLLRSTLQTYSRFRHALSARKSRKRSISRDRCFMIEEELGDIGQVLAEGLVLNAD